MVVAAHAPTSMSTEDELQTWWQHLARATSRAPASCIPLLCMDANARFIQRPDIPDTLQAEPCNFNAQMLQRFAADTGLHFSSQFSVLGEKLVSWRSPKGKAGLLDYVACPKDWQQSATTLGTVDLGDLHSDKDHLPICMRLQARVEVTTAVTYRRLSTSDFQSDAGRCVASAAIGRAPLLSWAHSGTDHVESLQVAVKTYLEDNVPVLAKKPRHPALTEATVELVRARRHQRRCLAASGARSDRAFLHLCFQAWQDSGHPGDHALRKAQVARYCMPRNYCLLRDIGRQLTQAMNMDKAAYARIQIEQARSAGPAEFAHRLRSILRTGKRFRPPSVQPAFLQEPQSPVLEEDVQQAFGRHFATAERAALACVSDLTRETSHPIAGGDSRPRAAALPAAHAQPRLGAEDVPHPAGNTTMDSGPNLQPPHLPKGGSLSDPGQTPAAGDDPLSPLSEHLPWDGTALSSIAALTRGFAGLKRAKAAGLSGIPAEAYLEAPLAAAIRYWPVIAKELMRDATPFHWRGSLAVPIPKPSKSPEACTGYRAIALLENDGKAVQKALRPKVVDALRSVRAPDQFGGVPGCSLGLPIACVRAHFDSLRREGRSGAAVFVDAASAYYAVVKDTLVLTTAQREDELLLRSRAALLFAEESLQEHYIQHARRGELAEAHA